MATRRPSPELVLSEWERDVLHAAAMIQVDRHRSAAYTNPPDPEKAQRWRDIASAIKAGNTVGYEAPKRRSDGPDYLA